MVNDGLDATIQVGYKYNTRWLGSEEWRVNNEELMGWMPQCKYNTRTIQGGRGVIIRE